MLYKPNNMKMVHAIIVTAFSVSVPNYVSFIMLLRVEFA